MHQIPEVSIMTEAASKAPQDASFVDSMRLTTLDLITILDNHRHHEADEVMSGLMRFERSLATAVEAIKAELSASPSPSAIYDAMNDPLEYAMRFGAGDLILVAQRAYTNFSGLLDDEDAALGGPAAADAVVWLTVAEQTRVAVKTLFQASMLHGRAPNGKRLEIS